MVTTGGGGGNSSLIVSTTFTDVMLTVAGVAGGSRLACLAERRGVAVGAAVREGVAPRLGVAGMAPCVRAGVAAGDASRLRFTGGVSVMWAVELTGEATGVGCCNVLPDLRKTMFGSGEAAARGRIRGER